MKKFAWQELIKQIHIVRKRPCGGVLTPAPLRAWVRRQCPRQVTKEQFGEKCQASSYDDALRADFNSSEGAAAVPAGGVLGERGKRLPTSSIRFRTQISRMGEAVLINKWQKVFHRVQIGSCEEYITICEPAENRNCDQNPGLSDGCSGQTPEEGSGPGSRKAALGCDAQPQRLIIGGKQGTMGQRLPRAPGGRRGCLCLKLSNMGQLNVLAWCIWILAARCWARGGLVRAYSASAWPNLGKQLRRSAAPLAAPCRRNFSLSSGKDRILRFWARDVCPKR